MAGLANGSTFGPYQVIEPLGRGGMASVYKVYEAPLDRYVALKVLPPEFLHDPDFSERFKREAKVIARLEHPNIIPIFGYGIEESTHTPWMAMRLIGAGSLAGPMKAGRLSHARVVAVIRGVADALTYAHSKGVVHRDVKPQNILLDEHERVYLADFGIARMLEGAAPLTQAGMITGTPQYMAPEQATGQQIDHRADIYALGVVAYEMLVGRVPFSADTPVAVLMKHVQDPLPVPPPSEVPEPLARALYKALTKKPEDRWATAVQFADALQNGLEQISPTARTPVAEMPTSTSAPTVARSVVPPPPPLPVRPPPPPPPSTYATQPAPATVKPKRTGLIIALVLVGSFVVLGGVGFLGLLVYVGSSTTSPQAAASGAPASPAAAASTESTAPTTQADQPATDTDDEGDEEPAAPATERPAQPAGGWQTATPAVQAPVATLGEPVSVAFQVDAYPPDSDPSASLQVQVKLDGKLVKHLIYDLYAASVEGANLRGRQSFEAEIPAGPHQVSVHAGYRNGDDRQAADGEALVVVAPGTKLGIAVRFAGGGAVTIQAR